MLSTDAALALGAGPGSLEDPTIHGGSLRLTASAAGGFDVVYPLPADGWRPVKLKNPGKGWRFHGDPIRRLVLRTGRQLKVLGKGGTLGHTLADDPGEVDVLLEIGERRYCLTFGGPDRVYEAGRKLVVRDVGAPSACPAPPAAVAAVTR
jgi:hypothetical protein